MEAATTGRGATLLFRLRAHDGSIWFMAVARDTPSVFIHKYLYSEKTILRRVYNPLRDDEERCVCVCVYYSSRESGPGGISHIVVCRKFHVLHFFPEYTSEGWNSMCVCVCVICTYNWNRIIACGIVGQTRSNRIQS